MGITGSRSLMKANEPKSKRAVDGTNPKSVIKSRVEMRLAIRRFDR